MQNTVNDEVVDVERQLGIAKRHNEKGLLWAVRFSSNSKSSTLFYSLENENKLNQVRVVSEALNNCD